MYMIHRAISRQLKCLFVVPRCTIAMQQVSPLSTTADSSSTNHTLTPQQPVNPKSSESLTLTSASTWIRPSEMPFQPKVPKFVNLIGRIQMPIHIHATPDGKHMAATLIAQKHGAFIGNSSNSVFIPIVFEGDLAHTVTCHVKPNDCVYVTGKLSLDPLPFVLGENQGAFYLIGNEINFVQDLDMQVSNPVQNNLVKEQVRDRKSSLDNNTKVMEEWAQFISKINQVSGIASQDEGLKSAIEEFERKVDGERLGTDNSTSVSVCKKAGELNFENKIEEMRIEPLKTEKIAGNVVGTRRDGNSIFNGWSDLVKNPMDWWDYREKKSSGSLKANYPDFKHKTNRTALWLSNAPNWVLAELGLKVRVPSSGLNEDRWKNMLENPDKWWDNRSRKSKVKSPDFRHKETGEGLWLTYCPEWVLYQLPCSKNDHNVTLLTRKPL